MTSNLVRVHFLRADDYKGFEEQIVGHKAEKNLISRYSSRIRIRARTLQVNRQISHIVLNKVYAPAELTDEWVASNDDSYTTVDELRKGLKETMQEYMTVSMIPR